MHLLDLPNEVLANIAVYLDFDSLLTLGGFNHRLYVVTSEFLHSVKMKTISELFLEWINTNGSKIRQLDLSNCQAPVALAKSIILSCHRVTDLNVVNSSFIFCEEQIFNLRELRKLSFTYKSSMNVKSFPAFASIRELYMEVGSTMHPTEVTALLNLCESIEIVHIQLVGDTPPRLLPWERHSLPLMAERWRTLHTVVLSHIPSHRSRLGSFFLEAVFKLNASPRIYEWIEQDLVCHIYEHGECNADVPLRENTSVARDVALLKRYHSLDLSRADWGNGTELFESLWGSPRSIRVSGSYPLLRELNVSPSKSLAELDLTECHGNYTESYRLNLLASAPSLQVAAFPLCFYSLSERESHKEEDDVVEGRCLQQNLFRDALKKLRLKKLFVKGVHHKRTCEKNCSCNKWKCKRCTESMTSDDLIDLSGFDYLGELTLDGVRLESSAYDHLANAGLRTVGLCSNSRVSDSGLRTFVRGCGRLENLRLENHRLDVTSAELWETLAESESLKQICLKTARDTRIDGPTKFKAKFRNCVRQVLQRIETVHLHTHGGPTPYELMTLEHRLRNKIVFTKFPHDLLSAQQSISGFRALGRSLCFPESFIGVVPPKGWS